MSFEDPGVDFDDAVPGITDDELLGMFAPRRANETQFDDGVEARIRALEEEGAKAAPSEAGRLRRAAAAIAISGASPGAIPVAGAKAAGTKWFAGALAFPALLLGSFIGTFVLSSRALHASVTALPTAETKDELRARKRRIKRSSRRAQAIMSALILCATFIMATRPSLGSDLIIAFLAATMISLTFVTREFGAHLELTREAVRRTVNMTLCGFYSLVILLPQAMSLSPTSSFGAAPSAVATLIGLGILNWRQMTHGKRALHLLLVIGGANILGVTHSSPDALRQQIASIEIDATDAEGWAQAATIARALRATGEALPHAAGLDKSLRASMAAPESIPGEVWSSAMDLDLLTSGDWQLIASLESHRLPSPLTTFDLGSFSDRFAFTAAVESGELEDERRAELIDAADHLWPSAAERFGLEKALHAASSLDALGRPDLVEARQGLVHQLLQQHWITPARAAFPFGGSGGFAASPTIGKTCFPYQTLIAVELMSRFGVPDGLDLRLVRSYLRTASRAAPLPLGLALHPVASMSPRAALHLLVEGVGLPKPSIAERIVAERLFLATVLLTLFGLLAVGWTPLSQKERVGAQP